MSFINPFQGQFLIQQSNFLSLFISFIDNLHNIILLLTYLLKMQVSEMIQIDLSSEFKSRYTWWAGEGK